MKKTDLNTECKDLEFIIDNLVMEKESYEIEDTRYNLEEGIEFLRGFLQELKGLNNQIIEQGNTPELLKKIYEKYTELWLFQLYIHVDNDYMMAKRRKAFRRAALLLSAAEQLLRHIFIAMSIARMIP